MSKEKRIENLERLFEGMRTEMDGYKGMLGTILNQQGDLTKTLENICLHPLDKIEYQEKHLPCGEQQKGGGMRKITWIFVCTVCNKWLSTNDYEYIESRVIKRESP